jgi:hypothetical protein
MADDRQTAPAHDYYKVQGVQTLLWVDDFGQMYCPLCGKLYGLHLDEMTRIEDTISIGGWCEVCGKYFAIDFTQHEGITKTAIRDLGDTSDDG